MEDATNGFSQFCVFVSDKWHKLFSSALTETEELSMKTPAFVRRKKTTQTPGPAATPGLLKLVQNAQYVELALDTLGLAAGCTSNAVLLMGGLSVLTQRGVPFKAACVTYRSSVSFPRKPSQAPTTQPKTKRQAAATKKETGLPKSYLMSVFKHFAKTKVSSDVYPVLKEV